MDGHRRVHLRRCRKGVQARACTDGRLVAGEMQSDHVLSQTLSGFRERTSVVTSSAVQKNTSPLGEVAERSRRMRVVGARRPSVNPGRLQQSRG